MPFVVFCYALEDSDEVREIGRYLECNCEIAVSYDDGRMRAGADLVDAVEAALSADVAVVFFSPASVPARVARERWEPVFCDSPRELSTDIAFVLLRDCQFPKVLLRHASFFDLSTDAPARRRDLKRWFLSVDRRKRVIETVVVLPELPKGADPPSGVLDELERRLSDAPGTAVDVAPEAALAFAHLTRHDFDGVFWIDCANRGRAGIVGDTARALGLRLKGTLDENEAALTSFVSMRRCLLVFAGLPHEHWDLAGPHDKCSVIVTAEPSWAKRRSDVETASLFPPGRAIRTSAWERWAMRNRVCACSSTVAAKAGRRRSGSGPL